MSSIPSVKEGQILSGTLFSEPMRIETVQSSGQDSWTLGLVGTKTERFRKGEEVLGSLPLAP